MAWLDSFGKSKKSSSRQSRFISNRERRPSQGNERYAFWKCIHRLMWQGSGVTGSFTWPGGNWGKLFICAEWGRYWHPRGKAYIRRESFELMPWRTLWLQIHVLPTFPNYVIGVPSSIKSMEHLSIIVLGFHAGFPSLLLWIVMINTPFWLLLTLVCTGLRLEDALIWNDDHLIWLVRRIPHYILWSASLRNQALSIRNQSNYREDAPLCPLSFQLDSMEVLYVGMRSSMINGLTVSHHRKWGQAIWCWPVFYPSGLLALLHIYMTIMPLCASEDCGIVTPSCIE